MIFFLLMLTAITASAQSTARKFVLKNSSDGQSELTCYLPKNPSGRAVVDCPGGGYSHLAMEHEGHQWAEYFNKQGIAFFVLKYRRLSLVQEPHLDRPQTRKPDPSYLRTYRLDTSWRP